MNNNPLISYDKVGNSTITTFHNCITALKEYENKSLEELRWEDYQLNRKYPRQLPPTISTANTNVSNRNLLRSSQLTTLASNQTNPTSISLLGTQKHKYKKTLGADFKPSVDGKSLAYQDTNHVCITAMHEYQNESFEELRYADYVNNCKFGIATTISNNLQLKTSTQNSTLKDVKLNDDSKAKASNDSMSTETDDIISCPICLESVYKVRTFKDNNKLLIVDNKLVLIISTSLSTSTSYYKFKFKSI
jgi:hypothetical protein